MPKKIKIPLLASPHPQFDEILEVVRNYISEEEFGTLKKEIGGR